MPPPAQPASRRSSVFKSPEATAEESLLQSAAAVTRDNNYNKTATVEHR